jgi:preprotein translocase subunit SecE
LPVTCSTFSLPISIPKRIACQKELSVAKGDKKKTSKQSNFITRYFRETIGEMRKVSWPTRKEAINLTIVVLIVITVMSTFLGVLDYIYSRIFIAILGS